MCKKLSKQQILCRFIMISFAFTLFGSLCGVMTVNDWIHQYLDTYFFQLIGESIHYESVFIYNFCKYFFYILVAFIVSFFQFPGFHFLLCAFFFFCLSFSSAQLMIYKQAYSFFYIVLLMGLQHFIFIPLLLIFLSQACFFSINASNKTEYCYLFLLSTTGVFIIALIETLGVPQWIQFIL